MYTRTERERELDQDLELRSEEVYVDSMQRLLVRAVWENESATMCMEEHHNVSQDEYYWRAHSQR